MKKLVEFIDKWGTRLTFGLVLIIFLKTCTTNTKIEKVQKELNKNIEAFTVKFDKNLVHDESEIAKKIASTFLFKNWETNFFSVSKQSYEVATERL